MVLWGRRYRSQANTKKEKRRSGSVRLFYSPYITVLCSFVNHDPWQDNTGVITSSNRPLDTTCCCHGRSQQRPELRVVRPWFDPVRLGRPLKMRISWLCPQKLVKNVGPPESRRISKCPDSSGDEPGWQASSDHCIPVNIFSRGCVWVEGGWGSNNSSTASHHMQSTVNPTWRTYPWWGGY